MGRAVYGPNLTAAPSGLADAGADDIALALLQGIGRDGLPLCERMPSGPAGAYAGLTGADTRAIAAYLLALPAVNNVVPRGCPIGP